MRALLGYSRLRVLSTISRRNYKRTYFEPPTMNELPSPHAPWNIWYDHKQSKYTRILIIGIVWWACSLGMAISTGSLYLNWSPPLVPAPPTLAPEEEEAESASLGLPPC